ncbi:VHL beta domain-containing protein [Edaphobacter bradus]|uniref:VHL beta domain-containing protein n=1 Tax=Edaphobacter bradus TaxID=2259016 RepID=UPI0021DFB7B4|nr:hypothetical protein [Edaphobacter bradus]
MVSRRPKLYWRLRVGLFLMLIFDGTERWIQAQAIEDKPVVEQLSSPQFGFYAKLVNCNGIFIRGAAAVQDRALLATCDRVQRMLARTDVTRQNLMQRGVELHLVGAGQNMSSLPEYVGKYAEGVARSPQSPVGIYGACNEVASDSDLDRCTHEFALSIAQYGFDAKIRKHIEAQFRNAIITGLWGGAAAATNPQEYWAQLSMWYFGGHGEFARAANRFPEPGPQGLRQYDPGGYALLQHIYSGMERPAAIEAIRARSVSKLALSGTSHETAELQLVNNSGQTLRIFWIDTEGHTRPMGQLGPYNRMIEDTFLSHVWMVEDQRGVELDRFVVEDFVSEYIAAD